LSGVSVRCELELPAEYVVQDARGVMFDVVRLQRSQQVAWLYQKVWEHSRHSEIRSEELVSRICSFAIRNVQSFLSLPKEVEFPVMRIMLTPP
jgi:hypothetical protein